MEVNQNIVEYYDELYPVSEDQKKFFAESINMYQQPVKLLSIECGTGTFEHGLAVDGIDVTGLESSPELLASANRKRRTQLMSIRFFQMTPLEMGRFLGKGFYNIVTMLDGRILLTHDETLLKKLFYDCKQLLTEKGQLILSLPNMDKFSAVPMATLPDRKSIRTALYTQIWTDDKGNKSLQLNLQTGNGKMLPVMKDIPIYPLTAKEIQSFAMEAGFTQCNFYGGFDRQPFTPESDYLIAQLF